MMVLLHTFRSDLHRCGSAMLNFAVMQGSLK